MSKDGGITFTVKGKFDAQAAKARIGTAIRKAQMKLDQQVITDSNFFCPLKTGALQKSAQINTVIGSGVWFGAHHTQGRSIMA